MNYRRRPVRAFYADDLAVEALAGSYSGSLEHSPSCNYRYATTWRPAGWHRRLVLCWLRSSLAHLPVSPAGSGSGSGEHAEMLGRRTQYVSAAMAPDTLRVDGIP